jgi:hypothetical protein
MLNPHPFAKKDQLERGISDPNPTRNNALTSGPRVTPIVE